MKLLQVTNRPRQAGDISKWQGCSAECCRNHQTRAASSKKPPLLPRKQHKMQLPSGKPPGSACPSLMLKHYVTPSSLHHFQQKPKAFRFIHPHLQLESPTCWENNGITTPDNRKTRNAFLISKRRASLNAHMQLWGELTL